MVRGGNISFKFHACTCVSWCYILLNKLVSKPNAVFHLQGKITVRWTCHFIVPWYRYCKYVYYISHLFTSSCIEKHIWYQDTKLANQNTVLPSISTSTSFNKLTQKP